VKIVLDTNIYSDYAAAIPEVVDFLATHGEQIFIPSIVIGELNYGFIQGSRQRFNENKLHQFIHRLDVRIISVDADVARKYALIYVSLRARGTKIPINDVWIAACCMQAGGTLITKDKHFDNVEQIEKIILNDTNR